MNSYDVVFYLKNGRRKSFEDIRCLEFQTDYVMVVFWNNSYKAVKTEEFSTLNVTVKDMYSPYIDKDKLKEVYEND